MANWLHLPPWLVVCQVQRQVHPSAQLVEGRGEVVILAALLGEELPPVLDLPLEDGGIDVQYRGSLRGVLVHEIVMHHPASERRVLQGRLEQLLLGLSLRDHSLGSVCNSTSVVLGGYGGGEHLPVRVHILCQYIVPLAEPDHDVPGHCHVGLQENRAHRDDPSQHELCPSVLISRRESLDGLASVLESGFVLAIEHGAPDDEVVVVHSVELVELGLVACDFDVAIIGFHRGYVAVDGLLPLPHPRVDVRWHVDEVPQARHARPKYVRGG